MHVNDLWKEVIFPVFNIDFYFFILQPLCFQAKFGGVQELAEQGKKPGDVAILKRGQRHIYYLVTKVS